MQSRSEIPVRVRLEIMPKLVRRDEMSEHISIVAVQKRFKREIRHVEPHGDASIAFRGSEAIQNSHLVEASV